MAKSYRELKVWQRSIDLAEMTYKVTRLFPKEEIYGLTAQMRRASVSIASNIAEGSSRDTRADFLRFVVIARSSNDELQTQAIIAQRLGFSTNDAINELLDLGNEIGRSLTALATYLRKPK